MRSSISACARGMARRPSTVSAISPSFRSAPASDHSPWAGRRASDPPLRRAPRAHAIPVAQTGTDIDGNLEGLICGGRGIKGAYWANYLSEAHVRMAGGDAALRERLGGMRIERLNDDGLLIVATDTPLPEDSEQNRQRFIQLEAALKPAFLSRAETPENKRALLGYFFRE